MSDKPYSSGFGSDDRYYVDGPGDGLSYYAGELWPELRCNTEQEAKRAAIIANTAFEQGYKAAQRDIRKALGVK